MLSELDIQVQAAEQEWLARWRRGPMRLRWTELPLQVGDAAPNFVLPDQAGAGVRLSNLWSEGPALLLFWRHFGCGCGIERAARLREEYDDYLAAGARVAIIGQGEPERAAIYAETYNLPPIPVLSDPLFDTYAAYSLLDAKPSQIVFDVPEVLQRRDYTAFAQLAEARREAGRPLVDSPWLLPGEFVIDQRGEVRLTYRYNYCEDFPDHRMLVAAIREAVWAVEGSL